MNNNKLGAFYSLPQRARIALITSAALLSAISAQAQTLDYVGDKVFTQGIEGPAVDAQGQLYVVNFGEEGTIGQVSGVDQAKLYVRLPKGSTGNGIRFDQQGFMYVADYSGHNVLKVDPKTQVVSIYAHEPRMNQPNDIAISRSGLIFASDPNWKESSGRIWLIDRAGKVSLLEDNMGTTNGIEVSTDERHLYVNESIQRNVWQYDLNPKTGAISNKKLLIKFADHGMDGMRCDARGNLYIARYDAGEVAVVSPQGKLLKTVKLQGKKPTNLAFGGEDGKRVFVTLQDRGAVEYFEADQPGRAWLLFHKKIDAQ